MATESGTSAFTEVQMQIASQASKDPAFRKELLSDPRGTLEREMRKVDPSVTLPETLQVHVHEQGADTLHLTVPAETETSGSDETDDGMRLRSITSSDTFRKTFVTWDCGCL